jgi:hypothetical protein
MTTWTTFINNITIACPNVTTTTSTLYDDGTDERGPRQGKDTTGAGARDVPVDAGMFFFSSPIY